MKIRPMGAELFHEGRRTGGRADWQRADRHKEANSHFSKSCEHAYEYNTIYNQEGKQATIDAINAQHWLNGLKTVLKYSVIQGESLARGPKIIVYKNYVIEIMTWKFIYTCRERWKTGPVHNRCWNWSPFTSKDTWMRFSKFWNTFPKVSTLTAWISWRIASLSC